MYNIIEKDPFIKEGVFCPNKEGRALVSFQEVIENQEVRAYVKAASHALTAQGYTEHSFPHVHKVATTAATILRKMGYEERLVELAKIAGYLHDIGNVVNRVGHAQSGALLSFQLLKGMGMDPDEIATVISAIGNHDEDTAFPVNPIAAALILADKSDVRRSRVQNKDRTTFDIHDRVNYAVTESQIEIDPNEKIATLNMEIDTSISSVIDYFEIFLLRMILCRRAADALDYRFQLIVNDLKL